MKTIQLTQKDADSLLLALGYANGASSAKGGKPLFTELVDRVLVQVSPNAYTYGRPRPEVVAELKADGIEVPEATA